jgi:hypothetical protein
MMKHLIKESGYFLGLFVLLSLAMHYKEWFDHPTQHVEALPSSSLGVWHPLVITFGVYLLLLMGRIFVKTMRKILSREK